MTTMPLNQLTHQQLITRLEHSVATENSHLARTILLLSEVSHRRTHLKMGYASLFEFCRERLCLSEGSIYRRIQVARAVRRFPILFTLLHVSKLTLTTASLLCPHLGAETKDCFILKFVDKTKTQVQDLLASLGKVADKPSPDRVRRVADRKVRVQPPLALAVDPVPTRNQNQAAKDSSSQTSRPLHLAQTGKHPITQREKCFQFSFVAGEELRAKLERVRDLLSHRFPTGRMEVLLDEVVTHYLNATLPKPKSSTSQHASTTRYIPRDLQRQVRKQAGTRCEWVGQGGRRCSSRRFLHLDHKQPLSLGGKTELSNLQILCSAHNHLKAYQDHGEDFVLGKMRRKG